MADFPRGPSHGCTRRVSYGRHTGGGPRSAAGPKCPIMKTPLQRRRFDRAPGVVGTSDRHGFARTPQIASGPTRMGLSRPLTQHRAIHRTRRRLTVGLSILRGNRIAKTRRSGGSGRPVPRWHGVRTNDGGKGVPRGKPNSTPSSGAHFSVVRLNVSGGSRARRPASHAPIRRVTKTDMNDHVPRADRNDGEV